MVHAKLRQISDFGQMGKLISNYDWSTTSVGDPEFWPSSLLISLGMMLENRIAMFVLWGTERIQFYNDAFTPLLGKKHPQALGQSHATVWAEIEDILRPYLDEVYKGKSAHFQNMPLTLIMNDGPQERFFTFSYTPIRLEDGTVNGVLCIVIDTTQEVLYKKELEKSEKSFRNYQEMSPTSFFSLTQDWVVDYINPAAVKESGRSKEDIVGKLFWDAFVGAKDSVFFSGYERAMKGKIVHMEGHYEPFDTWYQVFTYPLSPGIGVITQDVTESKRMQNELKAAVETRDRFLSIASHELNTPLTSLKLHTQMMEKKLDAGITEERLRKFFDQTDTQISRLSCLVGDMLAVSRIREGKLALNLETGDLKNLVSESVERFAAYYQNQGINPPDFSFEGQDFNCLIDLNRFEQVVSNLLMNALKYGEGKDVHVKICEVNEKIILTVEDHGRGIPESDQRLIFGQFFRANNASGEGLGLGLFIAKEIVDAHGGSLTLKSTVGKGSTFRVELPKGR